MKVLVTGLFLFSFCYLSLAQRTQYQFPGETWHVGSVTLVDGSRLEGNIKYDLAVDALQVQVGKKTLTYSANQIRQFKIFQEDIQLSRVFFSMPFVTETGYRRPKLFEVLFDGRTGLLTREFIGLSTRRIDNPYFRGGYRYDRLRTRNVRVKYLAYKFYLVSSDGKIELLGDTKKDVVSAFRKNQGELKRFIKSNKLKMNEVEDMTAIVKHYNDIEGS